MEKTKQEVYCVENKVYETLMVFNDKMKAVHFALNNIGGVVMNTDGRISIITLNDNIVGYIRTFDVYQ